MDIDYEEFNNILPFAVNVIQFFKNDYLIMFDFLKNKSPWDTSFVVGLNITNDELAKRKKELIENIVNIYYSCVIKPVYNSSLEERRMMAVDHDFFSELNKKKTPMQVFMTNEYCSLQVLKFYVSFVSENESINICTRNRFKSDLASVIDTISKLNKKYGIDDSKQEIDSHTEELFDAFYEELYKSVVTYNGWNFRNEEEISDFINYLYSLAYAYVVKDNLSEEEGIQGFKELVETTDNLYSHFYTSGLDSILLFELLDELLKKYEAYYDLRKLISDEAVQDLFARLDNNYLDKELSDTMINDFSLDLKLDYLLDVLCLRCGNYLNVYNLLMDGTPLYEDLIKIGLDARFTEYYKEQMIRKIIACVFEYESYNFSINNDIETSKNYTDIKELSSKEHEDIIFYFDENYDELLEKYHEYISLDENFMYRAKEHVYKTNDLYVIDKIYGYGVSRYFMIMLNKIKATNSVDYINKYIGFATSVEDKCFETDEEIKEYEYMIRTICLKVYEHIILDEIIVEDIDDIKRVFECEENIFDYYVNNEEFSTKIESLFFRIVRKKLTYESENELRKKITEEEHIKTLRRINPFDEY